MPGVRTTRSTPRPSASAPPATGGRLGPRRTTSSRSRRTRTGRPCSSARARAAAATTGLACRRTLPRWRAGSAARHPARTKTRRARGSAGSTHEVRSVAAQSPGGSSSGGRASTVVRRPCTLPRRLVPRPACRRPPSRRRRRVPRPGRRAGAVSSANPPWPSATSGATAWEPPPSSAAGRRRRRGRDAVSCGSVAGGDVPRVEDGAPSGAAAQVREEGLLHRGVVVGGRALGPEALESADDPRRAEPALAGPGGAERGRPAAPRVLGASPSTVVIARPATRRAGVTHATRGWPSTSTVQHPHWPCGLQPSLGDRRPSVSRSTSSSEPPRRLPRPAGRRPPAAAVGC